MKKVATSSDSVLDGVFLRSPDAVAILNEHGQLERMNPAAERLLATQQAKAAGRDIAGWIGFNPKQLQAGVRVELRDTARPVEVWVRSDLGQMIPVELTLLSTRLEGRNRRIAFMRDLTRQKAWQRQLEHQATHDAMTKLPDHDRVQVLLNRAVAYATENQKAIAFVCLGLNRFGEVNKLFGHSAGDEVLQKLARRLQSTLGNNGVVGRLGGDCFGAFLTHSDSSVVQRLQVLLERAIEKPFQVGDATVEIDASMGMALFPEHAIDAPTLMRRADLALSRAKEERRSLVLFREDRDATSKWPVMLTAELRKAIKDHDLRVVYQPKLSARTEKVVGVEALVRWKHPKLGEIPPNEFIGVAESSGLIGSVTTFVLNETIDQCARWRSMGMDLGISLNISARNLIDAELLQTLHEKIESTGIPRHLLTLEITESVIMEDPRAALEVVSLLHELGMGISIDDFGTGYSSLAYMKKLPASELKIDQSFVRDVTWDEESLAIVRSTIDLAHDLGMKVVGEGVETPETWNTLRRLGCDVGQGFLFSRPLMAGELLQWLAHGAKWSGQDRDLPVAAAHAGGVTSQISSDATIVGSKRLA